jgi:microcystin degradation protein MlrC
MSTIDSENISKPTPEAQPKVSAQARKIVVVKAGYLVTEIAAIANPNLMALTGGAVNQDIEHLESKHRVPSWPFQPDLQWKPSIVVSARSALK